MCDAGVLAHLAEQILTVDQLQRSTPERLELDPGGIELIVRALSDSANDVFGRQIVSVAEAFRDSIVGARTSHHEVHLREAEQVGVVEIDSELKR